MRTAALAGLPRDARRYPGVPGGGLPAPHRRGRTAAARGPPAQRGRRPARRGHDRAAPRSWRRSPSAVLWRTSPYTTRSTRSSGGNAKAERDRLAVQLHRLADQLRGLYGATAPAALGGTLRSRCQAVWDRRAELYAGLDLRPGTAARDDLLDVALLLLESDPHPADRRAGGAMLNELEQRFGPSPVFPALAAAAGVNRRRGMLRRRCRRGTTAPSAGCCVYTTPSRPQRCRCWSRRASWRQQAIGGHRRLLGHALMRPRPASGGGGW
ncbi:MAG: hypothetical protein U0736_26685 [Gemmataceae bacterium]